MSEDNPSDSQIIHHVVDEPRGDEQEKIDELRRRTEEWQRSTENLASPLDAHEREYFLCDDTLCRYLIARDWDVSKAFCMICNSIQWRRDFKPEELSYTEFDKHFATGKNYIRGVDRHGRPAIVMRVRLDKPGDNDTKLRLMIYQMERAVRIARKRASDGLPSDGKVVWLVDCKGFGLKNMDPMGMKLAYNLIALMNSQFPERLGVLYVINPPWLFSTFWKLVKPFISRATVQKVLFVSGKEKVRQALLEAFDSQQLEVCFGGEDTYEYDHQQYTAEMAKYEEERNEELQRVRNSTPAQSS